MCSLGNDFGLLYPFYFVDYFLNNTEVVIDK